MDPTLKADLASWPWRPDVALVVAGLGAVYVTGWCRLRRRKPKAVRPWRLALYLSSGRSRETLGMPWVVSWHAGRSSAGGSGS